MLHTRLRYRMDYWQYALRTGPETAEILMAFLSESPFDTFEETPEGINAFLPASADPVAAEAHLQELQAQFPFEWERAHIPGQNWNELWESNFEPVIVGDFCAVRAEFHAPIPGTRHELVIQPRMAFGTGHHETTWMCLAAMERLPIAGGKLLDYGCGTGILAILAARLGAASIEAVDIEQESYQNTLDNAAANDVHSIIARCGTLAAVQGRDFDGIFANINRNVILDSLETLAQIIRPGGWLLSSGFMPADREIIVDAAKSAGFDYVQEAQKGYWLCVEFRKKTT